MDETFKIPRTHESLLSFLNTNKAMLLTVLAVLVGALVFFHVTQPPTLAEQVRSLDSGDLTGSMVLEGSSANTNSLGYQSASVTQLTNTSQGHLILQVLDLRAASNIVEKAKLITDIDPVMKDSYDEAVYDTWLELTRLIYGESFSDVYYIDLFYEMTSDEDTADESMIHLAMKLYYERESPGTSGVNLAEIISVLDDLVKQGSSLEQSAWDALIDGEDTSLYFDFVSAVLQS